MWIHSIKVNILHINASDVSGGAARAAYRIHQSISGYSSSHGVCSRMRVIDKKTDDPSVIGGSASCQSKLQLGIQPHITRLARLAFRTNNPTLHSLAWPDTGLGKELNDCWGTCKSNLLHLHWMGDCTLSVEEIGQLRPPLVWTLHDQWAFCGSEHYVNPPPPGESLSRDQRFMDEYIPSSRPHHERGFDLNRITWQRKFRAWQRPIQIVCPSRWLAECARKSSLMAGWPISEIPNPIDLCTWAPFDKAKARSLLQLPQHCQLVLFGADYGTLDPRKGADLLFEALQILVSKVADTPLEGLELLVFGQGRPDQVQSLGFPVRFMGKHSDDFSLRLLYSAADVFIIPSRQDNLPNTGLEAHACGTPVVAFSTGGLVDIVDDRVTGALAEAFDPFSLAECIRWVLDEQIRNPRLGFAARKRAERLWNPDRVGRLYMDVYSKVLAENF